jgi:hypothetical protein
VGTVSDIRRRIFGDQITDYLTKDMQVSRNYMYGIMVFTGMAGAVLESFVAVANAIGLVFFLDFAYHKDILKIRDSTETNGELS